MRNQQVARGAFIDRHQCLFLSRLNDQLSLPVTNTTTLGHDIWAHINADLIGDGASSCVPRMTLLACFLAAQGEMQRAPFALVRCAGRYSGGLHRAVC